MGGNCNGDNVAVIFLAQSTEAKILWATPATPVAPPTLLSSPSRRCAYTRTSLGDAGCETQIAGRRIANAIGPTSRSSKALPSSFAADQSPRLLNSPHSRPIHQTMSQWWHVATAVITPYGCPSTEGYSAPTLIWLLPHTRLNHSTTCRVAPTSANHSQHRCRFAVGRPVKQVCN
jgi:hypothetical protein